MQAALSLAIQGVLALLAATPQIVAVGAAAKNYFTGLFNAGLISNDLQNALHARVDADLALFKAGFTPPPEFQVQPDPTPVAK